MTDEAATTEFTGKHIASSQSNGAGETKREDWNARHAMGLNPCEQEMGQRGWSYRRAA